MLHVLSIVLFRRLVCRSVLSLACLVGFSACGLVGSAVGTALAIAPLKIAFACLPEGTEIDTPSGPKMIETLRAGDWVIGFEGEPAEIKQIHGYLEDAENADFYKISFSNGSEVDLCSMHRIDGIRAMNLKVGSRVRGGHSVTEIEIYRGVERSYDILTTDRGYQIGGISVDSMIDEMYEAGRSGNIED
ncbi:MAG: Hint domain-containing protein [Verrucomicrobiota bacterium]